MDPFQTSLSSLSSRSSSVATSPSPPSKLTNDDIEAIIQMATSARPTPDGRAAPPRDTRTQLFVGNLPYRVRWQDLKDLFRRAGTVLRADVSLGPDNRSRGYGTVLLATAEDAGRAVDMFNGYSWQTRILEVRPDRLPPDLDSPLTTISGPAITGFPASPASSITSTFSAPAHIPNLSLHTHKFSDEFEYSPIFSVHDIPTSNSCRNLFVGNLPFHCQWQDLKDLFRQAGTIVRADVALGPDGRSRGFGTVVFATDIDAEHAMKMFNGYEYNGRVLKVHFDKFTQSGQTAASPSLLSIPASTASMPLASLSNLNNDPSSFGVSYPSQASRIKLPISYHPDYGPPSRSITPSKLYPLRMHLPHQPQMLTQSLQPAHPSLDFDVLTLTKSIGVTRLTSQKESDTTVIPTSKQVSSNSAPDLPSSLSSPDANNVLTEKSSPSSGSHHHHPHHPGPIALPPPAPVPFSLASRKMSSQNDAATPSLQTPVFNSQFIRHQQAVPMTPHGLPPITPSMPPFTFLPPPLSPQHYPSHSHSQPPPQSDLSRGQSYSWGIFTNNSVPSPTAHPSTPLYNPQYSLGNFSPGVAMSPGAFWGRPGNSNPFINPAVGAPVHAPHPTSPGRYFHPMSSPNRRGEPSSYFDPEYFPSDIVHPAYISSSLANEILKERPGSNQNNIQQSDSKNPSERCTQSGEENSKGVAGFNLSDFWKPANHDTREWGGRERYFSSLNRVRGEPSSEGNRIGTVSLSSISTTGKKSPSCDGAESNAATSPR
ncbi:hypothetical protein AX17_002464 [Amanita inopinata Kibby_2008]|nr:hypothetical protein AX17_002464 [Amanita inopinata Kibby_2008]